MHIKYFHINMCYFFNQIILKEKSLLNFQRKNVLNTGALNKFKGFLFCGTDCWIFVWGGFSFFEQAFMMFEMFRSSFLTQTNWGFSKTCAEESKSKKHQVWKYLTSLGSSCWIFHFILASESAKLLISLRLQLFKH